jgi:hypothetical protein
MRNLHADSGNVSGMKNLWQRVWPKGRQAGRRGGEGGVRNSSNGKFHPDSRFWRVTVCSRGALVSSGMFCGLR